jgi:hypothetical protein
MSIADISHSSEADPVVERLAGLIEVLGDPELAEGAASVTVRLTDDRELRERVTAARGTLANPLTDDEVVAKYEAASRDATTAAARASISNAILGLDQIGDIASLITRLRWPSEP